MKSVGEVMAIGRTFEESLQKAIRQVDPRWKGFEVYLSPEDLDRELSEPTDMRLFAIAYAMYNKNYSVDRVHDLTKIDKVGRNVCLRIARALNIAFQVVLAQN
jgi:carbamoyl-phosphate synthase large subunit